MKKKKLDSIDPTALHALLVGVHGVLLMEAGVTFDLLSGGKSGSRGSAAGQRTIANTQGSHNKRLGMTCGGVFRGTFRETAW